MGSPILYGQKRALVIGINNYPRESLNYCINDANDLGTTLESIGFCVLPALDCNFSNLYHMIDTFADTILRDDLVLFYFAGHGKQSSDENYLLPSDYNFDNRGSERDYIVNNAINVKYIMEKIDRKKYRVAIYLFDCCRNRIRTRAINTSQGLLPMIGSSQTLIVFACAPGSAVQDETRNNRNGSFMENLLKHITKPNKHIEKIMKDVADDVNLQTGGFQLPHRSSSISGKVFLVLNNDQGQDVTTLKAVTMSLIVTL
ncbi:unnamed protein product [Didymodactylos carnosus]|uniref:Peptidase C14 caspase domain-containing protein n=1 Tax=Didymodactylos carnosus TaxID=1234261 RepID=A0A814WEP3_9BILA|nr:unnamed protein product [Didymodactylos carnosus]CAF1200409.1 unnamed protein product [Didymodactylos carnosus]CAF3841886.1 unnamed protein product [Didymodactylos carnosus]CAF3964893.1 unnamed protein product [Didymodactylos carnosus]